MIYYLIPYCRDFPDYDTILQYTQLHSPFSIYPYITLNKFNKQRWIRTRIEDKWLIIRGPFEEITVR